MSQARRQVIARDFFSRPLRARLARKSATFSLVGWVAWSQLTFCDHRIKIRRQHFTRRAHASKLLVGSLRSIVVNQPRIWHAQPYACTRTYSPGASQSGFSLLPPGSRAGTFSGAWRVTHSAQSVHQEPGCISALATHSL